MSSEVDQLQSANSALQARIQELEKQLSHAGVTDKGVTASSASWEEEVAKLPNLTVLSDADNIVNIPPFQRKSNVTSYTRIHNLSNDEISRYSRHLILPDLGVHVQERWLNASVLIIGAGGLASAACLYLAAAGIGRITIIDDDTVEVSNLQRQVVHNEKRVGVPKAISAGISMAQMNSGSEIIAITCRFTQYNALELMKKHDIIMDATDNVFTRYLINDAAILCNKVVVSGSALRLEGQLAIYGYENGPCYRCLYPSPPPSHTVTNCSDGGVLGMIPGVIGMLQVLEILKILGKYSQDELLVQKLLLLDGKNSDIKIMKLRSKNDACAVCGTNPTITVDSLQTYEHVCQSAKHDKASATKEPASSTATTTVAEPVIVIPNVTVEEYMEQVMKTKHILLDVRDTVQYNICSLPNSNNYPFTTMKPRRMHVFREYMWNLYQQHVAPEVYTQTINNILQQKAQENTPEDVMVICRRGVYSMMCCELLNKELQKPVDPAVVQDEQSIRQNLLPPIKLTNIKGGLTQYHHKYDKSFPLY